MCQTLLDRTLKSFLSAPVEVIGAEVREFVKEIKMNPFQFYEGDTDNSKAQQALDAITVTFSESADLEKGEEDNERLSLLLKYLDNTSDAEIGKQMQKELSEAHKRAVISRLQVAN